MQILVAVTARRCQRWRRQRHAWWRYWQSLSWCTPL